MIILSLNYPIRWPVRIWSGSCWSSRVPSSTRPTCRPFQKEKFTIAIQCERWTPNISTTLSSSVMTTRNSFSSGIRSKGSSLPIRINWPVTTRYLTRWSAKRLYANIVRMPPPFPRKKVTTSHSTNSFNSSSTSGETEANRWTPIGDPSSICVFLAWCNTISSANLKRWIATWNICYGTNWTKVNWLDFLTVNRKPKRRRLCGKKRWNSLAQSNWANSMKCTPKISVCFNIRTIMMLRNRLCWINDESFHENEYI